MEHMDDFLDPKEEGEEGGECPESLVHKLSCESDLNGVELTEAKALDEPSLRSEITDSDEGGRMYGSQVNFDRWSIISDK